MDRGESASMNLDWEKELSKFEKAMASENKPLKMKAIVKLARLSKHAPEHVLSHTIPILMYHASHYIQNDPSPFLPEAAAYCLKSIACRGDGNLAISMGRMAAIHLIMRLLPRSEGKMQKVLIKWWLVLLTFCPVSRRVTAEHRGLEFVIHLLNSHINGTSTRRHLLEILTVLALEEKTRDDLTTLGALHLLVEAAGTGSMISRERACQSIGLLGIKDARHKLIELGAIPVVVDLMRNGDESTKITAANTIGLLSSKAEYDQNHQLTRPVTEAGAIPLFAELLQGPDPCGKEIAENSLYLLALTEKSGVEIVGHLVRILREGDDESKASAADVMWDLSGYQMSSSLIRDSSAIAIFVELLGSGSTDEAVMENVCGAFSELSYDGADRMAIAEAGAIPILMDLLHHENKTMRDNAAEAMFNLYEDPLYHDRVSDAMNAPSFRDMQAKLIYVLGSDEDMPRFGPRSLRRMSVGEVAETMMSSDE